MNLKRFTLLSILFSGSLVSFGQDVASFSFGNATQPDQNVNNLSYTGPFQLGSASVTGGVVDAPNWLDISVRGGGTNYISGSLIPGLPANDGTNSAVNATITYDAPNGGDLTQVPATTPNHRIYRAQVTTNNLETTSFTLDLSNLSTFVSDNSAASYDVYLYLVATQTGDLTTPWVFSISDGTNAFYQQSVDQASVPWVDGTFTQVTDTTTVGSVGNYVKFTGLTDDTLTITPSKFSNGTGQANLRLAGVQVVATNNPPPAGDVVSLSFGNAGAANQNVNNSSYTGPLGTGSAGLLAGVLPTGFWNDLSVRGGGTNYVSGTLLENLVGNVGNPSPVDMTITYNSAGGPNIDQVPADTADQRIYRAYLQQNNIDTTSFTVDLADMSQFLIQNGASSYDVYVYTLATVSPYNAGDVPLFSISDGTTTYYQGAADQSVEPWFDGTFTLVDNTDDGQRPTGDYVKFSGLTSDTLTISSGRRFGGQGGGNLRFGGIQVVAVPSTPTPPVVPVGVEIAPAGANIEVSFDSLSSQTYVLEVSTDDLQTFDPVLDQVPAGPVTGNDGTLILTDPGGNPSTGERIFYRVNTSSAP